MQMNNLFKVKDRRIWSSFDSFREIMDKVLMMKSCNVIKYFKISKSTLTHILWKYNSYLFKNAQTFPLRGKKKSVKLLQGIRNCCPLIEGAWQRDISMNNAGAIIKTPKNSYSFFYNSIFLIIIMLNKARGLLVGLWWHQQGLSGYAWQHHLKDDDHHRHHQCLHHCLHHPHRHHHLGQYLMVG